ncbi:MAG: signal recognition particle-docking protein FtsY [FCB group bacterium]|nr:signal recognition particle-docking protein FtsY [FCB group bacterium]
MKFLDKLFHALRRTRESLSDAFAVLARKRVDGESLEELEDSLLAADLGYKTVESIVEVVRKNAGKDFIAAVKEHLISILPGESDSNQESPCPVAIMVVGVNGTGKTTTTAKLANYYRNQGKKVVLIGTDTYRAAAAEQLMIWSNRLNIRLICNEQSREPAAVLFDGLTAAKAMRADVALIDTAGRLHTHKNLMTELNKMYRVIRDRFPEFAVRSFITIDANLGQNSLVQARTFTEHLRIDGAVLTKMDGTAKGGIVFALNSQLRIPVKFVGIGEQLEDLYPFVSKDYVESLFGRDHE